MAGVQPERGTIDVDALLALDEAELERQCRFTAYRSGGPGGQKRNKTASAARITHPPSCITAHSSDFRSQTENRRRALHRLRFKLAAELRTPLDTRGYEPPAWLTALVSEGKLTANPKNPAYARIAAHALDVLDAAGARLSATAALLGVPTSNVVHLLAAEPTIHAAAQRIRQKYGVTWRR